MNSRDSRDSEVVFNHFHEKLLLEVENFLSKELFADKSTFTKGVRRHAIPLLPPESSFFYNDSKYGSRWMGGRLDLRNTCTQIWLTRSLLHWVYEFDVDGFRIDSIEYLRTELAYDEESHHKTANKNLSEVWFWMANFVRMLRDVKPGALIIGESLSPLTTEKLNLNWFRL